MDNYEKLLDRISKSSGLEKEEIERKVEAKKAKLSGLISKEGAAQIVAAELGINFDLERMKISELVEGMKKANVLGKIVQLNPIKNYSKNGREGKIGSFTLADESSNIRTVLWDTNHISMIENGKLKEGSVIEISNAAIRNNELHLSSFADIKESKEKIESVALQRLISEKKLIEAKSGEIIKTRAFIVGSFEPRYFDVCPKCGKKAIENECKEHGAITPEKRAVLSITLDDGTETIRSSLFGETIKILGLTNEQIFSLEELKKIKNSIIGEEKIFTGQIKNNAMYNTNELSINSIESINTEALALELESKIK